MFPTKAPSSDEGLTLPPSSAVIGRLHLGREPVTLSLIAATTVSWNSTTRTQRPFALSAPSRTWPTPHPTRPRPKLPSWKLSQSSELGSLCSAVTWQDPEEWLQLRVLGSRAQSHPSRSRRISGNRECFDKGLSLV
ncbi:hypothetical protein CGCFRS4_v002716 [Colletotrichum fructicola]|nr:hypothetical protein CGCFRS4_v002716 [Colletotrichum fructicola]